MRNSLLTAAVLCTLINAAAAQSNVSIYGVFDGGVRFSTNANAAGDNVVRMSSNGTYLSNRLGFRGVEDLGGGLKARIQLESAFNGGTGTGDAARLFGRTASVGLEGPWGSVTLGRQYTIAFRINSAIDPFDFKYAAINPTAASLGAAGTRNDNDIQYTGKFGPVTLRAEYALGEVAGNPVNASARAIGASYVNGPFNAGFAYTLRKPNLGTAVAPSYQDNAHYTLGAAYTMDKFRVLGGYAREKQESGTTSLDPTTKLGWLGGIYTVAPGLELTAAVYQTRLYTAAGDGKRTLTIIGATYDFSKRTLAYAALDIQRFSGIATGRPDAAPFGHARQNGLSVGINHLF